MVRGARIALVALGSALAPAAVLIACTSDVADVPGDFDAGDARVERAVDDAEASTDGASSCPLPIRYGSEECERCLGARCCDVILGCEAHPVCNPLSRCILECKLDYDAGGCRRGCEGRFPDGVSMIRKIDVCGVAEAPVGCREVCATTTR